MATQKTPAHATDSSRNSTTPDLPPELVHFDQLPDSAFVRLPVVIGLLGCSASAVWRNSKAGHIPRPRKISNNISGWNVGELRQALANRPAV